MGGYGRDSGQERDEPGGGAARHGPRLGRRGLLRGAALGLGGALVGGASIVRYRDWRDRHPPVAGGPAPAADLDDVPQRAATTVRWKGATEQRLAALTFDDGPAPNWTPMVLDTLAALGVPATFFLVGERVVRHGRLVRGRYDGHEVGNHSWSHRDLSTLDFAAASTEIRRAGDAIADLTGRAPRLLRPPLGHLGGSTLEAANRLGYDVVLWSQKMHERRHRADPPAAVREVVAGCHPGSIILAHDTGRDERLVTLRQLGALVRGIQERGFRLVTVSELLTPAAAPAPPHART